MSQENVEVIRRAYEALNRGDLDGAVEDAAQDFEYIPSGTIPGTAAVYRGPEGLRRFLDWFWDEFADTHTEIHEFIEADDQVLVPQTLHGRGQQSGIETTWDVWIVWTLRGGTIVHGQGFTSREQALEAVGLRE
jgi:ketosteroid isomerase-like protein